MPAMHRTFVYIDGFNFYYRALRKGPFKWLNFYNLMQLILQPTNDIAKINYYTARVSGAKDPDQPRRQQIYFKALKTIPQVEIFFGSFITKTIKRPLAVPVPGLPSHVEVLSQEEKGSDVNIATHLIYDGCLDKYDVAIVVSKDTDLVEPIRIVTQNMGKKVGIVCPDENLPSQLGNVSTFCKHVRKQHLSSAQFPNVIFDADGQPIEKPKSW
ncbi:hypothetical protein DA2_3192 [Desulfovibrio sp. A2]|nr:hypothetical protein DA2_3192 [Desulfovibrio sp. A2]